MAEPSTDQPQTTSAEPTEPHRGGTWLLWLFALPVIYFLSIGPVVRYFSLGIFTPSPKALNTFYAPLQFLCRKIPAFQHSFDWYVDLWVPRHFPRPANPPLPPTSGTSTN